MPLPKIATPTYELELPSSGQNIKYRPFLVKEEKLLVIALESEDNKQITNAIKAVIKACILTKGIKVEILPTFDIEYLFLNIRGKSVGEEIEVNVFCPDDGETQVPVTINLDDIHVQKTEDHTNKIKIDDSVMMEMKYPSLDQFIKNNFDFDDKNAMDQSFDLIASCIGKIYTEDEVWSTADCTKKEVKEVIDLADKEDELDDLFDKISGGFEESIDWLEDNFSEAIRQLSNADMVEDYRDGLSQLDDVQAEIKNLLKLRNDNYHLIEEAEQLDEEVYHLRNKV